MFLRRNIFLLPCQQIVRKELLFHLCKADSRHRIRKALSRNALFPEQQNRFLHNRQHFFPVRKDFVQIPSLRYFFTPSSADVNPIAVRHIFQRAERAFPLSAAAVIAGLLIDDESAVL